MPTRSLVAAMIFGLIACSAGTRAQTAATPAKPLEWDVTSVKPGSTDSCPANSGGIRYLPNGLSAFCVPLVFIVENAYRLMDPSRIVGLPQWATGSQVYTVDARVSGDDAAAYAKLPRDAQFRMLQPVLAERFHMKAHMEPREIPPTHSSSPRAVQNSGNRHPESSPPTSGSHPTAKLSGRTPRSSTSSGS